jgi:N utilization substance protein B
MKSALDPRHQRRRSIIQQLFAESFTSQQNLDETTQKIMDNLTKLDDKIKNAAPTWPVDKLNKIDLAILRLAIFEMEEKNTPPKVIIDEAVELAKEFGSENSPSFVNGVLGTILKNFESVKS